MALTVLETTEQQLLPCQQAVEQGAGDGGKAAAAAGAEKAAAAAAVMLKETDHGGNDDDDSPLAERDDIWNMIQAQKKPQAAAPAARPAKAQAYVHPLVRRSSGLLTQKSLEICTESLGSETGSDGFSDADGSAASDDDERAAGEKEEEEVAPLAAPPRAFPPPLPTLARRKVESTMEMKLKRQDGRLLVKVVPVTSSTLFRAQRRGGRLLLSFADTAVPVPVPVPSDELLDTTPALAQPETEQQQQQHQQGDEEEEEEEDEVEVVGLKNIVEVTLSAQPQVTGLPRVHHPRLVINKFVSTVPVTACEINDDDEGAPAPQAQIKAPKRPTGSTTPAVAALAAALALSATAAPPDNGEDAVPGGTWLMMTAKRHSSKEELMKHMRRCSGQLSPSMFVWEGGSIATST